MVKDGSRPNPAFGPNADLGSALSDLLESATEMPSALDAEGGPLVAEVMDTHHPHLPGRIYVGFSSGSGESVARWLPCARGLDVRRGDRVLLTKPVNWSSWIVTTVVEGLGAATALSAERGQRGQTGEAGPSAETGETSEPGRTGEGARPVGHPQLALGRGEQLWITSADGQPLVHIDATERGPVVRVLGKGLDLDLPGTIRLKAEAIELEARSGGVDIRTDGDAVMRARFIRLN